MELSIDIHVLHSWIARGQVHVAMIAGGGFADLESYPIDDLVGAP